MGHLEVTSRRGVLAGLSESATGKSADRAPPGVRRHFSRTAAQPPPATVCRKRPKAGPIPAARGVRAGRANAAFRAGATPATDETVKLIGPGLGQHPRNDTTVPN